MSTEIKLLPCPFCGDSEWLELGNIYNNPAYKFTVSCKTCGAESCDKETAEEAAAAWNRRAPQTVAVIAPAIEWGKRKGFLIQSKCGWYDLRFMTEGEGWQAWSNDDRAFSPLTKLATSEIEAKAACQAHLQAQVNTALGGCNVRDLQPFLDALAKAKSALQGQMGEWVGVQVPHIPESLMEVSEAIEVINFALKSWEETK